MTTFTVQLHDLWISPTLWPYPCDALSTVPCYTHLHFCMKCKLWVDYFSSVQFSHSVVSDSLWPHELQHARPPCPSLIPGVHSDSSPLSQWCHPAISSSVVPFSSRPHPSQHQSLFQWVNSLHEVAKVLEFQLQHHFLQRNPRADLLQNGLVGSPCSPRDSQESSPIPQFKSIDYLFMIKFCLAPSTTPTKEYILNLCVCVSSSVMSNYLWPMDCNPRGSSVHGISQARILEWVAIPFFRVPSQPRDWTCISCIDKWILTIWATKEVHT